MNTRPNVSRLCGILRAATLHVSVPSSVPEDQHRVLWNSAGLHRHDATAFDAV